MRKKNYPEIGERFGRLVVESIIPKAQSLSLYEGKKDCIAKCDCGKTKAVFSGSLRSGGTQSCGCLRSIAKVYKPIIGQRFGKIRILEDLGLTRSKKGCKGRFVKIECDCGKQKTARTEFVMKGKITICAKLHGYSRGTEYTIWRQMKARCSDSKNKNYPRYGERGITVCDRWMVFKNFLQDMGPRPKGMSLDRIDNDKAYSKENCRWATVHEQARNRSTNRFITHNGETKTITEWAKEKRLLTATISRRIKAGWSLDKVLAEPKKATYGKLLLTEEDRRMNLYFRWKMMIKRCTDSKHESYHRYGGRGVQVCQRWIDSFDNFFADVGYPEPGESLDRIDNEKGYGPENTRWVSSKIQSYNKSNTAKITCKGKTKTRTEWAKITGIPVSKIRKRIERGLSPEQALEMP